MSTHLFISPPRRLVINKVDALECIEQYCYREGEHILWYGTTLQSGYGQIEIQRRRFRVHRVIAYCYITSFDLDDPEMLACHSCDIKNCCEPNHISQGTQLSNTREAIARGLKPRPLPAPRLLTSEQVVDIREMWGYGITMTELAGTYKVSIQTISDIVHNKTYTTTVGI
jgi:hypothetical protein